MSEGGFGIRGFTDADLRKWALDTLDITRFLKATGVDPYDDMVIRMTGAAIKMLSLHPTTFPVVNPIAKRPAIDSQLLQLHDDLQQMQTSDENSAATADDTSAPPL